MDRDKGKGRGILTLNLGVAGQKIAAGSGLERKTLFGLMSMWMISLQHGVGTGGFQSGAVEIGPGGWPVFIRCRESARASNTAQMAGSGMGLSRSVSGVSSSGKG